MNTGHSNRPTVTTIDQATVQKLRANMRGSVLTPGDAGYNGARAAWNTSIDQYPALVALVAGVADVITVLAFARTHELPVAVQSIGHGVAYPCNGAVLVNTSQMKGIWVDPDGQTVRVEA